MKLVCNNRLFDICTNLVSLIIILLCITIPVILGSLDLTALFVISVILGIVGFIIAIAIFCGELDDCLEHNNLQKLLAKCGLVSVETIFLVLKEGDKITFANRYWDGLSDTPAVENYVTYQIEAKGNHYCKVSVYTAVEQTNKTFNFTKEEFISCIKADYKSYNSILLNDVVIYTCL